VSCVTQLCLLRNQKSALCTPRCMRTPVHAGQAALGRAGENATLGNIFASCILALN